MGARHVERRRRDAVADFPPSFGLVAVDDAADRRQVKPEFEKVRIDIRSHLSRL